MPLFVSSTSAATRHGVFAIKRTPKSQIRAQGTSVVAMVGQFPWGPKDQIYQVPTIGEAKQVFAPVGMDRTMSGYLCLLAKSYPSLRIVRVLGTASDAAEATLDDSGTDIVTVVAKYHGTAGNSMVATVSDASDGDSDHFNLTVTVSNVGGSTTDTLKNVNFSGTTDEDTVLSTQDKAKLQLIGDIARVAQGRPDNGEYTFSGGADGTIDAAAYVGTAGAPDNGISLLEGDPAIRHVFADDCGSGLRAAVNAGLVAHQILLGDRCVYLNGDSGQTVGDAQTDVENYRGAGVAYVDPWVYIRDDTTQAETLVPPASFEASVAAQLSPSTSPAWKSTEVKAMLQGIVRLEVERGDGASSNTAAGITTIIREDGGGHTFEAAPNTIAPQDPTQEDLTTTRMDQYIATAFVKSVRGSVDAPNVPTNRDDLVVALEGFMGTLKTNKDNDPNHRPHVLEFNIAPLDSENTPQTLAEGDVFIPLETQYSTGMKRIFLVLKSGTAPLTITPA